MVKFSKLWDSTTQTHAQKMVPLNIYALQLNSNQMHTIKQNSHFCLSNDIKFIFKEKILYLSIIYKYKTIFFIKKKNGRTTTSKQSMKGDVLNDQTYGMECKSLMLDRKNQHNVLTQQH